MDIPLGKAVEQPTRYEPSVLAAVPRSVGREAAGIDNERFQGWDDWTAYELCWPGTDSRRNSSILSFRVPADSPFLIESKSLKLYFNSCFYRPFENLDELIHEVADQLSHVAGKRVKVELARPQPLAEDAGEQWLNLDQLSREGSDTNKGQGGSSEQFYHTDAFRSLCPVTGQPDWASFFIRTEGPTLSPLQLRDYLYGFSEHRGFHEQCVEQVTQQLLEWDQRRVAVLGRFLRRGGLDINPLRTTDESFVIDLGRLLRQ